MLVFLRKYIFFLTFILSSTLTICYFNFDQKKNQYPVLEMAKWSKKFWSVSIDKSQPLNVLNVIQDKRLFNLLFPGYPEEMRFDSSLWSIYFNREFDQKIQIKELSINSESGVLVPLSWIGCLDIYQKYGADILLIGASNVAQGVMIDSLYQKLKTKYSNPRILACTTPAMTPDIVSKFLIVIKSLKSAIKIKWTIIGLGPTEFLSTFPFYETLQFTKLEALADFKKKKSLGMLEAFNQKFSIPFSWNDVIPVRRLANHLPIDLGIKRIQMNINIPDRWSIDPQRFTNQEISNEEVLIEKLNKSTFKNAYVEDDLIKNECQKQDLNVKKIDNIVSEAQQISENVLLFLFPTIGTELRSAPDCLVTLTNSFFERKSTDRVRFLNIKKAGYGLEIKDYVLREGTENYFKVDLVHPNKNGAEKITSRIVDEILKDSN